LVGQSNGGKSPLGVRPYRLCRTNKVEQGFRRHKVAVVVRLPHHIGGFAMHSFAAAGAGFLLAVSWFDLMFDVQTRRHKADSLPPEVPGLQLMAR
jgi:hypothetical protein